MMGKDYRNLREAIRYCSGIGKCENCPQDFQCNGTSGNWYMLRLIADALDELEKRVEVVRCKDCTHSLKGKTSLECEKYRYEWNNRLRLVDDNDFCCWGVRKDGDGE